MRDRAGFFAGLGDILTAMCVYYVAAGILIMSERGWGLHLFWLLLWAAVCAFVFAALMKKPRGVPLLTAVTAALFLGGMALFLLASSTPPRFGYALVLAVGAGMAAGLPLYYCVNRTQVLKHLTHLDVLIMALLGLLLMREALGIDGGTVALMVLVLFLDAAGAVGLRMSDGDGSDGADAFRASMVALASAAALALVIWLLTMVFSRSGDVTGGVLRAVGGFFAAVGSRLERFFRWLAELLYRKEEFEPLPLEEMPSLAGLEQAGGEAMELHVNTTAVGVALCVLAAAAAVAAAVILRRMRLARGTLGEASYGETAVRRTGGAPGMLWRKLREALAFRWAAFVNRDTPGGLLVTLERTGRRARAPRGGGESMRDFIRRMDPEGGLDELADALDREYYGGGCALSARRCREIRKRIRTLGKAVQHG